MSNRLSSYLSLEELSAAAADQVIFVANEAIESRGVFRIALAGGSTPRRLFEVLSSEGYRSQTDWSSWVVYLGDERVVPLTDNNSNYAMANASLLSGVPIKESNVYIPPVDRGASAVVASEYERAILQSFDDSSGGVPRLDLILLGLGSDGHTASLFPGKPALDVRDRLVVDSTPGVLPPPVDRITFTLPFINAARNILFLAGGKDKAEAFKAAYEGAPLGELKTVPAHLVQPENGDVYWFVTQELVPANN